MALPAPGRLAATPPSPRLPTLLLLLGLALAWGLVTAPLAAAAPPALEEGRDYERVDPPQPPAGGRLEVVEVINFKCPHCFEVQKSFHGWMERNQGRVAIRMIPVFWGRQTDTPVRAYWAAHFMGKGEAMKMAIFTAHFEDNRDIENPEDLADLAREAGLDPQQFKEQMNAFGVLAKVAQGKAQQAAFGVNSTPTFVINGRYRVNSGHVRGDWQRLFQIVDTLLARP